MEKPHEVSPPRDRRREYRAVEWRNCAKCRRHATEEENTAPSNGETARSVAATRQKKRIPRRRMEKPREVSPPRDRRREYRAVEWRNRAKCRRHASEEENTAPSNG